MVKGRGGGFMAVNFAGAHSFRGAYSPDSGANGRPGRAADSVTTLFVVVFPSGFLVVQP